MRAADYGTWIHRTKVSEKDLSFMQKSLEGFAYLPKVSVLMETADPDEIWIKKSVSSVLGQIYPHFEFCICDNASRRPHVREVLEELETSYEQIKTCRLPGPSDPAKALNEALSLATGEFVILLGTGDTLSPETLFDFANLLQDTAADVIYADEDHLDLFSQRSEPTFKPFWSPDLLLSTMYIGRPALVRRSLILEIDGFREGLEGAEEHDFMLRVSETTGRFYHVPKILYHRRFYSEKLEDKATKTHPSVVKEALKRRRETDAAEVVLEPSKAYARVIRKTYGRPTVSVVSLFPGESHRLEQACSSVEDGPFSLHQVIPCHPDEDANKDLYGAQAANFAANEATGDYLLFLKGYPTLGALDWITALLQEAQRTEVGLVGGKIENTAGDLLYAGRLIDLSQLAGPSYGALPEGEPVGTDLSAFTGHAFNPLVVYAGCMMVRRSIFEDLGGFDEQNTPAAFYDLDLSFRFQERGFINVYAPEVSVVSASENSSADVGEITYMWERWWHKLVTMLRYSSSPLHTPSLEFEGELLSLSPVAFYEERFIG